MSVAQCRERSAVALIGSGNLPTRRRCQRVGRDRMPFNAAFNTCGDFFAGEPMLADSVACAFVISEHPDALRSAGDEFFFCRASGLLLLAMVGTCHGLEHVVPTARDAELLCALDERARIGAPRRGELLGAQDDAPAPALPIRYRNQRAGDGISDVVMATRCMVNAVAATTGHTPLEATELGC